jgi:hypothetical protein
LILHARKIGDLGVSEVNFELEKIHKGKGRKEEEEKKDLSNTGYLSFHVFTDKDT